MAVLRHNDLLAIRKRYPESVPDTSTPTRANLTLEGGFLEAWAQGYSVGSLIILILIVFCNYRSGTWLHKLILLELILVLWHGAFIFIDDPWYGWYLSATATLNFISYFLHNVVSWLKIRPFLPRWGSRFFIISLLCVQPFWVAEAWSNFSYFNSLGSDVNIRLRPWEALFRDPWWIFTTWKLIDAIKETYGFKLWSLVQINKRFGVMLLCMALSIVFLLTDVVVTAANLTASSGINPYWRFALVFKCASDTIFLDDFKSVLDDIVARKFGSTNGTGRRGSIAGSGGSSRNAQRPTVRGEDFIECSDLEHPSDSPVHNTVSSQATALRSKLLSPFSRVKKMEVPKSRFQGETSVPSQTREYGSWDSNSPMLPMTAHTAYGNKTVRANQRDGDLMIRRLA